MNEKRIVLLVALIALILFACASSQNDRPAESWILIVTSANQTSETEFDLSLALGAPEAGFTQSSHTTPFEVELDAKMILAIAASATETPLRVKLKNREDNYRFASGRALRCIAGRNVSGEDHFVRAF